MRKALCALCAFLLLCCGCSASAAARPDAPAARLVPAPSSAAVPTPLNEASAQRTLSALWAQTLQIDISAYVPEAFFSAEAPWQFFDASEAERAWLPAMAAGVKMQLSSAAYRTARAFTKAHGALAAGRTVTGLSWQLLYSLLQGCTSAQEANARIMRAVLLNVQTQTPRPGVLSFRLGIKPMPYRKALRLPGEDESAFWSRCFSYSYFSTVFGGNAEEIPYAPPPDAGNLATGLVWPLGAHTRLRKTWYAQRDGGRRKHTGTDIWAKADTEIYSCTEGTVSYVGEGEGTGFAVIVTDAYGYQFHYYHMIRLSAFLHAGDTVAAGALIGHVGNTGNSDLDHLHLTITAPDGRYVNPYPYLAAAEP